MNIAYMYIYYFRAFTIYMNIQWRVKKSLLKSENLQKSSFNLFALRWFCCSLHQQGKRNSMNSQPNPHVEL